MSLDLKALQASTPTEYRATLLRLKDNEELRVNWLLQVYKVSWENHQALEAAESRTIAQDAELTNFKEIMDDSGISLNNWIALNTPRVK